MDERRSRSLIGALISSAFCTAIGGHGVAPLILVEISGLLHPSQYEGPEWKIVAYSSLIGQALILFAWFSKDYELFKLCGLLGIGSLAIAIITLLWPMPVCFVTAVPFISFAIVFSVSALKSKQP